MFSCRAPRFTTFHAGLKVREGLAARPGIATTYADQYQVTSSAPQSAICAEEPMSRGAHYAEFLVESGDRMLIGVVDSGHLSQASGASPPWPWKEPRTWALEISRSVLAAPALSSFACADGSLCLWLACSGRLQHGGKLIRWSGTPRIAQGDTVGLMLEVEARTMTVYKTSGATGARQRLGKMATNVAAEGGGGLCWAVGLVRDGDAVRVRHGLELLVHHEPTKAEAQDKAKKGAGSVLDPQAKFHQRRAGGFAAATKTARFAAGHRSGRFGGIM